jgi:hypothetical protein
MTSPDPVSEMIQVELTFFARIFGHGSDFLEEVQEYGRFIQVHEHLIEFYLGAYAKPMLERYKLLEDMVYVEKLSSSQPQRRFRKLFSRGSEELDNLRQAFQKVLSLVNQVYNHTDQFLLSMTPSPPRWLQRLTGRREGGISHSGLFRPDRLLESSAQQPLPV